MYLKNLYVKGFKSFAKKTALNFEPGVTMVVGPNGSGKSNIVDAVQWVLGEQSPSQMRGSTMEDVIFAGTQTSKPLSVCEVSLVLDNQDKTIPLDFSEINITRRLLKTGESDYFINGSACRLLDIFELLSDSGLGRNTHSIIAQGRIDEVIHCKPEERRHLLEEAAGVLKHKKRKERSLRKLSSVDDNLKRVKDILREVKKQTGPLKAHMEKAKKYKELEDRLQNIKIASTVQKLQRLRIRYDKADNEQNTLKQKQEDLSKQYQEIQENIKTKEKELDELQQKYSNQSNIYLKQIELKSGFEKTQLLLNQKLDKLNNDLQKIEESDQSNSEKSNALEGKKEHLTKEKIKLEKELKRTYERLKETQKNASEVTLSWKKQSDLLKTNELKTNTLKDEILKLKEAAVNIKTSLNTSKEKIDFSSNEISKIEKEIDLLKEDQSLNNDRLKEEGAISKKLSDDLEELDKEKDSTGENIFSNEQKLIETEKIIHTAESKKESLEKMFGFKSKEKSKRFDFNEVIVDEGYRKAFESAVCAYYNLQTVSKKKDITKLTDENRANKIVNVGYKPPANKDKKALINKLEAPPSLRRVLRVILNGIYTADDINQTDETSHWVLKDGSSYYKGILSVPGEIDIEKDYQALSDKLKTAIAKREDLNEKLRFFNSSNEKIKSAMEKVKNNFSESDRKLNELKQKSSLLKDKISSLETKREELNKLIAIEKLSLAKIRNEYSASKKLIDDKTSELKDIQTQTVPIDKDIENKRQSGEKEVQEIKLTLASLNERVLFVGQQIRDVETELGSIDKFKKIKDSDFKRISESLARLDEVRNIFNKFDCLVSVPEKQQLLDFDSQRAQINELKNSCFEIERSKLETTEKLNGTSLTQKEIQTKVESITEKITEDFQISLEKALELADFEFEEGEAGKIEERLQRMGAINFAAYDEYSQLQGREEFLEKQVEDLLNSKKSLKKILRAIDDKIKTDMIEAFELVKVHFEKMFAILFPGGRSNLYLTDENDILNTGVELEVQPAGKKLSKLSLLSGGETALTALALLFAIYHAKPSPFYVLDEVEAALDDINLQRFIRLIDDMKSETQFIVITHQRRTMEIADSLYGVSMQADGISRVISQKLEKSPERAEVEIA